MVSTEVAKKNKMAIFHGMYHIDDTVYPDHSTTLLIQVQNTSTNMAAQISKKRKVRMPCHYCHRPTAVVVVVALSQLNARFGGCLCILDPGYLSKYNPHHILPLFVQFVADGVFYAELNELLTRELAADGYSGVEVRVTPLRTEIIIRATRTQNVLGTW